MQIAFIPAKGFSSAVPKKNLQRVGYKTLLEHTIDLALSNPTLDEIIISTESEEVISETIDILKAAGLSITNNYVVGNQILELTNTVKIHKRSLVISGPYVQSIDVVLEYLELRKLANGFIYLLQPTSPFRTIDEFLDVQETQLNEIGTCVASIKKVESQHPEKCFKVKEVSSAFRLSEVRNAFSMARQSLTPYYTFDGAYYTAPVDHLLRKKSFLAEDMILYLRSGYRTLNIDSYQDLAFARFIFESGSLNL